MIASSVYRRNRTINDYISQKQIVFRFLNSLNDSSQLRFLHQLDQASSNFAKVATMDTAPSNIILLFIFMIYQLVSKLIIWIAILKLASMASVPVDWVGSSDYQSGTVVTTQSEGTLNFNYDSAFPTDPKKMLIGYSSMKSSTVGNTFRIDITVNSTGTASGKVQYKFYTYAITITSVKLRYMVVSSDITWLSCNHNLPFDYYMNPSCPALFSGTGKRVCTLGGDIKKGTGTTLNLSHKNVMLIWPQVIKINTVPGQQFSYDWTSVWVDQNNYEIRLTLYGYTTFTNLSYNRLIYDQTAIEANQTVYLDGDVINGTNSNYDSLRLNLLFTSSNSFMIGISYFSIPRSSLFDFEFNPDSMSSFGSMTFSRMSLAYWNYRLRSCRTGYPYFVESLGLCYDVCDPYMYPLTSPNRCQNCHFTCYTCTSSAINSCTSCGPNDGRTLKPNNKCTCTTGYYETNVAVCGKCHYSCATCSSAGVNSCLTCSSANGRTISANSCPCQYPLIDNGVAACANCTVVMPGCTTCASVSTCTSCNTALNFTLKGNDCQCNSGLFLNATTCDLCSSAIVGCSTCSDSASCATCKEDQFFQLLSGRCVCKSKYYNNSNTCSSCSATIPGCNTCTSGTQCTTCNSSLFFVKNGLICECQNGYIKVSNVCIRCDHFIPGCQSCTSSSICTSCNTANNFYLNNSVCECPDQKYINATTNNCQLCSINPFCFTCSNSSLCSQCDNKLMAVNLAGGCSLCSVLIIGCSECDNSSFCNLCNSSLFFQENAIGSCSCIPGMFLGAVNKCQLCNTYMLGCTSCNSDSICDLCDSSLNFELVGNTCQCINKHFLINNTICLNCSTSCQCAGYYMINGACQTICGDGILTDDFQECDDGNGINRDGCSSSCSLEPNFTCVLNSLISECSYNKPLNFNVQMVLKHSSCNQISLVIGMGPDEVDLTRLNFSDIIIHNSSYLKDPTFAFGERQVTMTYEYTDNIEKQLISFTFVPSKDPKFNLVPNSTLQTQITSVNNQPMIYYEREECDKKDKFNYLYHSTMIAAYLIFVLSMFTNKIVGIQVMGVIQIAFFALANLDFINIFMTPLSKLKAVNGFNYEYHMESDVPKNIFALQYNSDISNNINVMLLFPALCLVVSLVLYLCSKKQYDQKNKSAKLLEWAKSFMKQYYLTATMFSLYNISFSSAVFMRYGHQNPYYYYNLIVIVCSNLFVLNLVGWLIFSSPPQFGEYKKKLKLDFMSRNYFIISILYRYALGFVIGFHNSQAVITVIQCFMSVGFIVYLISNRPFFEAYHNYRGVVCEMTTFTILCVGMYYRSMKSNIPIETKALILDPSYLHIWSMIFCVIVSVLVLVYEIVISCKIMVSSKREEGNIVGKGTEKVCCNGQTQQSMEGPIIDFVEFGQ